MFTQCDPGAQKESNYYLADKPHVYLYLYKSSLHQSNSNALTE